ncbi:hypothetical protein PIB30_004294 [Stylosanthes scabra]|uniref:Uncharacterized protein n=1 Tax=Stylosanthes scabra TaxID=79078 RepID=A0ABU6T3V5_9FABA|nr:hypothetical protein [Stylosanthes scabra]
MGQLLICNMNSLHCTSLGKKGWNHALPHCKKGWNHAEVAVFYGGIDDDHKLVPTESIVKEIGMHVVKQKDSSIIEDIRFTDPHKMAELIMMMMMLSKILPNHKKQPLLLETCIGLWTLLFLTHTLSGTHSE